MERKLEVRPRLGSCSYWKLGDLQRLRGVVRLATTPLSLLHICHLLHSRHYHITSTAETSSAYKIYREISKACIGPMIRISSDVLSDILDLQIL